jgi:hypothetical protein
MSQVTIHIPDGIKEMHIFEENTNFPVVVYICNEWEKNKMSEVDPQKNNTESLCRWCRNYHIQYQILTPTNLPNILKHPRRYLSYCVLKARLSMVHTA